jgi:ribonuclease HI
VAAAPLGRGEARRPVAGGPPRGWGSETPAGSPYCGRVQSDARHRENGAGASLAEVELWTDGACSGNPGPGGWAALLRMGRHERVLSGGESRTTNNRMELAGVVHGLRALTRPCRVRVHLDSSYVRNAFTNGWLARWQRNGWVTSEKQPVKNRELWQALLAEVARHDIEWVKVAGHAGVVLNERVDRLACKERDRHARAQAGSGA